MIVTGLDIETTGLDQAKGHRIIEICLISYNLETRQRKLVYNQRINPERSIDAAAQAVHGITLADLVACPKWPEIALPVHKIISMSHLLVAHNGNDFDFPFVGAELMRIGLELPNAKTFDTMVEGRWATPLGKLPTLQELCFACGVEYDPEQAHAAQYDVERMMECFFRAVDWGFFNHGLEVAKAA